MNTETSNKDDVPEQVVVLGSGYAGIHAVRKLLQESEPADNLEIILLSKTDHLLYVTMIYEVVAGNLAPSSIRQSVRTMLDDSRVTFLQGAVNQVDFDNQIINYRPKDARSKDSQELQKLTLSYDYLVSAIGSETNFFGTPGAAEYAYTLKTLNDAEKLKNKIINHFEEAELATSEEKRRELLSIVVVGGGPTGVTLSAKIADLLNNELAAAFPELISLAQITILEASDSLLSSVGSWFSQEAAEALSKKKCVEVRTNHTATEVRPDRVVCDNEFIRSQCVIWTAGVRARSFEMQSVLPVETDTHSRRIYVDEMLQVPAYQNVFVAGDQAWVNRPEKGPYPMRAQFAVRQGQQAGENILHLLRDESLEKFSWADKGVVVSVGEGRTYAQVGGFQFSGIFATLAYKSIYLMSTIGIRAKLRAMLEWVMNLFLPRDVSEL